MASLKPEGRIIERFRIIGMAQHDAVAAAARHFGCSRTTVYKLQQRYRRGGLLALANQPRGPQEPVPHGSGGVGGGAQDLRPHRFSTKIRQLLWERYGVAISRQSV